MDNGLSYRELRVVHQSEKRNPNLTEVDPDFFEKARGYIKKIEESLASEKDEHKRKLMEDELKSAKQILLEIYELREKKIVLAALSKIRGGKPDTRVFLKKERELFDEILKFLENYRKIILEGEEKEVEKGHKFEESGAKIIALIKDDIPRFVGPDMKKYNLRKNDLVTLPESIFKILEKRGVAERVL